MTKKLLLLTFIMLLVPANAFAKTNFMDIDNHWAKQDIEVVYQKGVMVGTKENLFNPDKNVTRAQLAVCLDRVFNLNYDNLRFIKQPQTSDLYDDVKDDHWYSEAILDVSYNNIFDTKNRQFNPNKDVSRIEVAEAIRNSFEAKNLSVITTLMWPNYKDVSSLNKKQSSALGFIFNTGIMKGRSDSQFNPDDPITRAELAAVLNRTLETIRLAEKVNNKNTDNEMEGVPLEFNVLKNLSDGLLETISKVKDLRGYEVLRRQNDEAIIYIGSGEKPTGGYNIEVESVKNVVDKAVITVKETSPGKGKMLIQMITYPYTVIKVSNIADDIKVINTNGEVFENVFKKDF